MYHAAITNKGYARLEAGGSGLLDMALVAIAEPRLTAPDPRAMFAAFAARMRERLGDPADDGTLRALWRQLADEALIRVREPLEPGTPVEVVLTDPPVEHYRARRGTRPGADDAPLVAGARQRVRRTVSLGSDTDAAVRAAQAPGETYSETVERLIRDAARPARAVR